MQRLQLVGALKRALRARGITYAQVAAALGISEATIKRLFHRGDFTLSRLEAVCEIAGLQLSELVEQMASSVPLVSELTREQELELIRSPRLLLMSYLLINRWEVAEITAHFEIEPAEARKLLRRLRDLELIEILPFDRVKVLTARNFSWRRDGPVHRYFLEQVQRDFFDDRFEGAGDALYLLGGLLSEASRQAISRRIERLVAEIDELSGKDARLPRSEREPYGAVIGLRSWEFAAFKRLRRAQPRN